MNKRGRPRNWEKSYQSYLNYAKRDEERGIPHKELLEPEAYRDLYNHPERFTPTELKNVARTVYMNTAREVSGNMVKFLRTVIKEAKTDISARKKDGQELQEWEEEVLGWKTSTTNLLKVGKSYYNSMWENTASSAAAYWNEIRQHIS